MGIDFAAMFPNLDLKRFRFVCKRCRCAWYDDLTLMVARYQEDKVDEPFLDILMRIANTEHVDFLVVLGSLKDCLHCHDCQKRWVGPDGRPL